MVKLRSLRAHHLLFVAALVLWLSPAQMARADQRVASYQPISQEELKMTGDSDAPGAPAIILYRSVLHDDSSGQEGNTAHEDNYYRIKVLTEEGRKAGDVEIEYPPYFVNIVNLHARTIKPDGTVVEFEGKAYTKMVAKGEGVRKRAKTFTLPAVEVGSILEYYYTIDFTENYVYDSEWILNEDLFTKSADFTLKPFKSSEENNFQLRWTWENMPAASAQPKQDSMGIVHLHLSNVPAFIPEDLMPPENELKGRVDFIYSLDIKDSDPAKFWAEVGRKKAGEVEGFAGKPKNLASIVDEIVAANDPPEVKLQKIYARVQKLRNTSFEVEKTEEEKHREKEKEPASAADAWKKGYADGNDLTWLYLGLVRAAGIEAYPVLVPDRAEHFFDPKVLQEKRLQNGIVLIKLNGKDIFCDPGTLYTPYGLLPWQESGVQGLQLDKKDPVWIQSLNPSADQARIERRAALTLSETGDLEGKLTVTYAGLQAGQMRTEERNADAADQKKYLEDMVKGYVAAASEVTLTNQPDWKSSEPPLVAEFNFKVPGWASQAGHHVLLPMGLLGGREKRIFDHADRIHDIYVSYPYKVSDDVEIQLPPGWKISNLPTGWTDTGKVVTYTSEAQDDSGKLHMTRAVSVNFILLPVKFYPAIRRYYQQIKAADDQEVVVEPGGANASN